MTTDTAALAKVLQEGAEAIRDLGGEDEYDFADACETAARILARQPYTLTEIRNGTGFPTDAVFAYLNR